MISRHIRTRRSGRVAAVVMLMMGGIAAACHHVPFSGSATDPTFIYFTNESLDQADIYAVVPGVEARRIGTVMAGRTDTLTLPTDLVSRGTLNIVARLFARSTSVQTGPVNVNAGEEYAIRLPFDQKLLSFLPAP
jgi:hypothetical protein